MDVIWKFIKQGFFFVIGTIAFPLFLILFFDLGAIKVILLSFLFAMGSGAYLTVSTIKNVRNQFKPSLTKSYFNENMKDAKRDIKKIKKHIYEIPSRQQQPFIDLYKSMKNIVDAVEEYPDKYHQAKLFFNDVLPNAKTITERYEYLSNQPIHNEEIKETLRNTEVTVLEMKKQVDEQLLRILTDDAQKLNLDINYIKHTNPKDDDRPF